MLLERRQSGVESAHRAIRKSLLFKFALIIKKDVEVYRERRTLMKNNLIITCMICVIISFLFASQLAMALPLSETLEAVADSLVKNQSSNGSWSGENGYTGSIVSGLTQAYQIKGTESYKESAEKGVQYILDSYGGNFYGDEAYALARLTEVTGEQGYADLVLDFYNTLNTYEYIRGYDATTREKSTFFIAFHTVASHMVGATDAAIWREALISHLSLVGDDFSFFPVMTLGIATWALVQTGPMDDTRIDPFGLSDVSYWEDVMLSDLPDMLVGHQVPSGEYAGSFYVRFDHTAPGPGYEASGYTEDTIFGLLGLIAANAAEPANGNSGVAIWDFQEEIQNAREVLAMSVHQSGLVQEHIWSGSQIYFFFGGELLQTLFE